MLIENMLEVELLKDFSVVRETLTRIGISSKKKKTLYQSCHILHKRGLFYIVHFKEMFLLDNKKADISAEDFARRNLVTEMLEEWGLIRVIREDILTDERYDFEVPVRVIPYKEKEDWTLVQKYSFNTGEKRNAHTTKGIHHTS